VVASVFDLVPKPVTVESLQDAITRATDGAEFTDAELERAFRKLTESERKITALVVDGKASCEIRAALGVSRKTVEAHRARIMDKTRAEDVGHLARLWRAWKQYG
jgi:two-component system response regulator FixJ